MKFTAIALLGSFVSGTLAIHTCVEAPASSSTPDAGKLDTDKSDTAKTDVGKQILDKAMTAADIPYAWGGGSCDGPSHDQPPYQYGDIGYDCSGLVCWAVCQITGRDLFSEGLRVTSSMYCASEKTLGYKKYPYEERKAGDAVFFGGECDCADSSSIYHVGLMMDSGDRMWNAPNDRVNKVQENSIASFGDTPCPYVIRFN